MSLRYWPQDCGLVQRLVKNAHHIKLSSFMDYVLYFILSLERSEWYKIFKLRLMLSTCTFTGITFFFAVVITTGCLWPKCSVYESITDKTILLSIFVVEFKSELIYRNRMAAEGNWIVLQAKTLPAAVLGRRDILGAAETGSGKTLAFGIPILHRILEDRGRSAGRYNLGLCAAALLWLAESDT